MSSRLATVMRAVESASRADTERALMEFRNAVADRLEKDCGNYYAATYIRNFPLPVIDPAPGALRIIPDGPPEMAEACECDDIVPTGCGICGSTAMPNSKLCGDCSNQHAAMGD